MNTESKYIKIILRLTSELCPSKKKTTYSNEYYLEKCINVLRDTTSWAALGRLFSGEKYHYKTIQDKFFQWSELNIFEMAYNELLKETYLNKYDSHNN